MKQRSHLISIATVLMVFTVLPLFAQAYLEWIEAPYTRMVIFERSAHIPFLEEPGRFFVVLLEYVLPLTEGAATYKIRR